MGDAKLTMGERYVRKQTRATEVSGFTLLVDEHDVALAYVAFPADAQLYSAAADLYAALLDARTQLEDYELERSGEVFNDPKINAALAKALG